MSIEAKHLTDVKPEHLVLQALNGLIQSNPALALDRSSKVIYDPCPNTSHVALISGGGSGHEPAHSGFVGKGMLTAAVCGNVFASPNEKQVTRALELVDNQKGSILVVKNYTGDVLNFGLAKELHAAIFPEKAERIKIVVVGDDVAVGKSQGNLVGRRGLAGTVLVYKIAGALSRRGASLNAVYDAAMYTASRVASIGVSQGHVHVPGTSITEPHLKSDEMEIGMGIHNEQGVKRLKPSPPFSDLVSQMLDFLTSTTDLERSFLPLAHDSKDRVVLMVNNLGSVSELEMGVITAEVTSQTKARGISISRVLSGTFMTSLNMPGFSITLLLLPREGESSAIDANEMLALLDEKADAPGWKWTAGQKPSESQKPDAIVSVTDKVAEDRTGPQLSSHDHERFLMAIKRACQALCAEEPKITEMDNISGDGDCGLTLQAGAQGILTYIGDGTIIDAPASIILRISEIVSDAMGGTSGALFSIFFSALARALRQESSGQLSSQVWSGALGVALERLYSYTRARPPSRTLVDPLAAFIEAMVHNPDDIKSAVKVAAQAAEETKDLEAKAGRSAYVEGERLREKQVADPGAWGVKVILEALISPPM